MQNRRVCFRAVWDLVPDDFANFSQYLPKGGVFGIQMEVTRRHRKKDSAVFHSWSERCCVCRTFSKPCSCTVFDVKNDAQCALVIRWRWAGRLGALPECWCLQPNVWRKCTASSGQPNSAVTTSNTEYVLVFYRRIQKEDTFGLWLLPKKRAKRACTTTTMLRTMGKRSFLATPLRNISLASNQTRAL